MDALPKNMRDWRPEHLKLSYKTQYDPHWTIATLLDPRFEVSEEELLSICDDEMKWGLVIGDFDYQTPGWLPRWFPYRVYFFDLTPGQRLQWFDEAVKVYISCPLDPQLDGTAKQRIIAEGFLAMYDEKEFGHIDEPHELLK